MKAYKFIFVLFVILLLFLNLKLYYQPSLISLGTVKVEKGIQNQFNFLEHKMKNGAAIEMQRLFPEGYFFMNLLYGLSWVEYGKQLKESDSIFVKSIRESSWALANLESEDGSAVFDDNLPIPLGAFYNCWSNYLRAKRMEAFKDSLSAADKDRFHTESRKLATAFDLSDTPFPESYPGAAWPADALPGIASLQIHDRLFKQEFQSTITNWLIKVEERLDPATGLISHSTDFSSGKTLEGARGCSQSLMNLILVDIDTAFAKEQYLLYRKYFFDNIFGLPMIREYPKGKSGWGDIDSGPVVFGAGFAASVVGLGTTNRHGDKQLSLALCNTIEAVGFPYSISKKKQYIFGLMPVGDAFLLWSKLQNSDDASKILQAEMSGWRMRFHITSVILISICLIPLLVSKVWKLSKGRDNL